MNENTRTPPRVRRVFSNQFRGVQIECVAGDMAAQADMQAVVRAVVPPFAPAGGDFQNDEEGDMQDAPRLPADTLSLKPGRAVLAGDAASSKACIIHCRGPVYGVDQPAAELLANCYREAMRLADARGAESIAFPALSTGDFGLAFMEATEIACAAILGVLPSMKSIRHIRLVFLSATSANIACTLLCQQIRRCA